jgi:hypothetical protein
LGLVEVRVFPSMKNGNTAAGLSKPFIQENWKSPIRRRARYKRKCKGQV